MIKINILVGFALLVLARADVQDNTIISMQSEVYCEHDFIPDEYLHYTLYACADATFLPPSSIIDFSLEDRITPVNRMSMALYDPDPNGCFTYVPRHTQFTMCFNASTTSAKAYLIDKKQISINRAIYYGNIGNQFEDDQVWPIIHPVDGYKQCNLRFTETYSALKNEKIIITIVTPPDNNYILKLTIEEEKPSSKNIRLKKWKQYDDKYLLNEEVRLSLSGERVEYVPPKDVNFRVYFYTFAPSGTPDRQIKKLNILTKVTYGSPANFDMDIDKKIWPEPSSIPGYFQNDFYRSKVYDANEGDKVYIYYEVLPKPGYILKIMVQEENEKSGKWEKYNKNYIINEELIFGKKSYVEFLATKKFNYRVFVYTFAKNDIVNPLSILSSVRVITFPNGLRS
ncbi:hypothetical protein HCN44_010611 [Aphidius gifuensis]|uniref:Uncharacterized protein n=1 Tax=Aphidius gifuensis TaxID=684658 RepID=A0A834XTP3_APHGI|nr:hypothetical protein HCN44_010611 [Aphidius gifuensis]